MKMLRYTNHQHKDRPRYTDLVVGEYPVAGEEDLVMEVVADEEAGVSGNTNQKIF